MSSASPFAYPPEGNVLVMADGPELYVWGANDTPLWKQFCDGILVGVAATRDRVFALDADGRIGIWRAFDGSKLDEWKTEVAEPRDLAYTPDGALAILGKGTLGFVDARGGQLSFPIPGKLTAISFGANSASVGVGLASGTFQTVDTSTGMAGGQCELGAEITGVAWRAPSQWAVAAGTRVHLISADGATIQATIDAGAPLGRLACPSDGALVAAISGQDVAILELHGNRKLGAVRLTRDVHGVSFGPGAWLGIGLDDGDANRVELMTGQMCKSEPQPGRTSNRWGIRIDLDVMQLRQAVTAVRAGGGPIARHIRPEEAKGGRGCLWTILTILGLSVLCGGCSGLAGLFYYFVYLPQ